MTGGSTPQQTSTTTTATSTSPWKPTQPLLKDVITALKGQSTDLTSGQSSAVKDLQTASNTIPGFNTSDEINNLLGFDTAPQVGMLSDAYGNLKKSLSGIADPANLNPLNTPGIGDSLKTLTNDITNSVKGTYAGAGRDPTGAGTFAQSLGRGLMQGEAPVLTGQYNANVGNLENAAGALENAGVTTAGQTTTQEQAPLQAGAQAIGLIPSQATAQLTPEQARLSAANTGYQLPYGNINALLQPSAVLGSLGSQSSGTAISTLSQPQSTFGNVLGGLMGGTGMLSQMGAFGPSGWLLASDERVKEDVEEIGKLHDGQTVHRFRYKGDPTMRMGLLAQEVAEHEPDAVHEMPTGLLMVDHARATERAAHMRRAA